MFGVPFNGCTFPLFITLPLLMNTVITKVLVHTPAVCAPEWDLPDWVSRSDKQHDAYQFACHRESDSNIRPRREGVCWAVHGLWENPTRLRRGHSAPVSSVYSVGLGLYRTVPRSRNAKTARPAVIGSSMLGATPRGPGSLA